MKFVVRTLTVVLLYICLPFFAQGQQLCSQILMSSTNPYADLNPEKFKERELNVIKRQLEELDETIQKLKERYLREPDNREYLAERLIEASKDANAVYERATSNNGAYFNKETFALRAPETPFSPVLKKHGYQFFFHQTSPASLVKMLQGRYLWPFLDLPDGKRFMGGSPRGAYVALGGRLLGTAKDKYKDRVEKIIEHENATKDEDVTVRLIFDLQLLDEGVRFHISATGQTNYGSYDPYLDFQYVGLRANPAKRLDQFFSNEGKHMAGEVVSRDPYDLKHLKFVYIKKSHVKKMISALKDAGVNSYNGVPIESFIRPIDDMREFARD